LLQRTKEFFFPPAVSDRTTLEAFIGGEASYVTQKTVVGYCRVKAMQDYEKLLTEAEFRDGQDICRWEGYALALGDVVILVEGYLRPGDPQTRTTVADALAAMYPAILDSHIPVHRQTWDDAKAAFAARFALACQSEPVRPDHVVEPTARLIHDLVPIHKRLKREDREVILGDLRLHMVAVHAAMQKRFRPAALVAALSG
jgi:hypothetical protein